LALTLAVGACLGDPSPDPEDLPLEIVVHPDECLINYPQVGPGIHDVTVIFEGTSGSVRIVGTGETVFSSDAGTSGSADLVVTQGTADLVVGDYQVECDTDGVTRQIALSVRQGLPPGGG
jgi:hypothetical protein